MDPHDIDWERLDRYVRGRGTPEELDTLRRWVESDPELRALAEAMATVGRPPGAATRAWDVRSAWQHLQRRMRRLDRASLRIAGAQGLPVPAWRRILLRPALAAAAVLALVAGVSLIIVQRGGRKATGDVAVAPMREVSTRRGQRAVLDLPDGSRVTLAPASRLRIPLAYRAA